MPQTNRCRRYCFLNELFDQADTSACLRASAIIRHILDYSDRKLLAVTTALSCDPDEIIEIAEAALEQNTLGMPLPCFETPLSDARWWADRASTEEKKAYAIACYQSLDNKLQQDFISFVTKGIPQ